MRLVLGEAADHVLHIGFQPRILRGIGQRLGARALHPAGIVHAGNGRMLRPQLGIGIPAGIEQHEKRLDAVPGRNRQKGIHALLEARRILLPQRVMQEHPHGGHAHALRPAQLLVDRGGIEARRLPHLQLVDGIGGNIVAAHRPFLLAVPGIGLGRRPALARLSGQQSAPARPPSKAAFSCFPRSSFFRLWNARVFAGMGAADGLLQLGRPAWPESRITFSASASFTAASGISKSPAFST